ncbi:PP2C family protein-serine/threonine phosphatase [Sphingobacterium sp. NGMCC 1.201703]|uniref:PP2C family protein-serine/threonine phosphatase n=1 Tax=Sphingobacterium sp. NGMCC 1.201703 TaxID=3388657 RepID=UPI0039FC21F6
MNAISAIYALIEKGKRQKVEDYIFPRLGTALLTDRFFIVCDGVGGNSKGEVASQIVAETLGNELKQSHCPSTVQAIHHAVLRARTNLQNFVNLHPEAEKMSTTLTLAIFEGNNVQLAWCGDSKIYHIRKDQIRWKSKDHSLVQHLVDTGEIGPEEMYTHPNRNVILRSVSIRVETEDISLHHLAGLEKGDYILLATDGIFEHIDDEIIITILNNHQTDKSNLFYQYCEGKTNDNYSMYLLQIDQ